MLVAFSVTPIGVGDDVGRQVAEAVRVVRESGLPNRTDAMFTTIEGEWDEVMDVVRRAAEAVDAPRVSLTLKADIRPGVSGAISSKVESVERYLAHRSPWEDVKSGMAEPAPDEVAEIDAGFELGQLIYDLRTRASLSQAALAKRMGTTQSVVSRLEEGGGTRNRLDTLARVAGALERHMVVSFPVEVPDHLDDAVRVA